MATFNIKRGDSMPPLIISMRVAGTDPDEFYDLGKDQIADDDDPGDAVITNATVKFILTNVETGEIVGSQGNVDNRFTGTGEIYEEEIPGQYEDELQTILKKKTLLRYNWLPPHDDFNPSVSTNTEYGGDTGIAGVYKAEFEVFYESTGTAEAQKKKRTFPATPGDTLIVNILTDSNDKQTTEAV